MSDNAVCVECGTEEEIVHSGTDGIWLGVLEKLHKICYPCGNKIAQENWDKENLQ